MPKLDQSAKSSALGLAISHVFGRLPPGRSVAETGSLILAELERIGYTVTIKGSQQTAQTRVTIDILDTDQNFGWVDRDTSSHPKDPLLINGKAYKFLYRASNVNGTYIRLERI